MRRLLLIGLVIAITSAQEEQSVDDSAVGDTSNPQDDSALDDSALDNSLPDDDTSPNGVEEAQSDPQSAASATIAARPAPRNTRRTNKRQKGKNRCRVLGCSRCSTTDRSSCEICRQGFAVTPEGKCAKCGTGCQSCSGAGPDKCDKCQPSYTIDAVTGQCERCAPHCLQCDEAGPGGCNECGKRRMLHVRLELQGEVHECLSCGTGCASCSKEHGCEACDAFYVPLLNATGCSFSWLKLFAVIGGVLFTLATCVYCLGPDEPEVRQLHRRLDHAEAVRSQPRDDGGDLRRRGHNSSMDGGSRGKMSMDVSAPPARREGSYPLLPGYSGIEIVD